jgi:hypothetical protein
VTFGADNGKKWCICSIAAPLPAPHITAHNIRREHGADNRAGAPRNLWAWRQSVMSMRCSGRFPHHTRHGRR